MNNITFEKAMERLEEIAHLLEKASVPLDESMKLFEESRQLTELCLAKLDEAEKKVLLLNKDDNSLQLTPAELE